MANIFVYENRMWKAVAEFTNSGEYPFTMPAGEHLLMCHGAAGGSTFNSYHNLGGVAYGIINLPTPTPMHAYVGGNGGDAGSTGYRSGRGGYNGGGDGGRAYLDNSGYMPGAGGGGASDIRLHTPSECSGGGASYIPDIPSEYQRVTYIETTGNVYFNTGYIAKENTTFVFSTSYTTNGSGNIEMAFLGAQSGQNTNPGWVIWLNSYYGNIPKLASIYGNMSWSDGSGSTENYMARTTIPAGERATYQVDKWGTFVNGHPLCYNSNITGEPMSNTPMYLCTNIRNNNIQYDRLFSGKIYYVRAFEYENNEYVLKMELIPCYRKSDGAPGLYDTQAQTFIEQIKYGQQYDSVLGSSTSEPMVNPAVTERYYPTISDEYEQLEYVNSNGGTYFDSGYNANTNSVITFRDAQTSSTGEDSIFGTQSATNQNPGWVCWQYVKNSTMRLASIYGTMEWNESYAKPTNISLNYSAFYRVEKDQLFVNLSKIFEFVPTGTPEPDRSIFIMGCRRASSLAGDPFKGRLYHFRIYEKSENGDILKHEFVPCKRLSDDVVGLYDTVEDPTTHEHNFIEPIAGSVTAGPTGSFPIVDYDGTEVYSQSDVPGETESLNTRIIVAGGGGGGLPWSNNYDQETADNRKYLNFLGYTGIGGGINGGYREIYSNGPSELLYATQTSGGYFGKGQSGRNSTIYNNYGYQGASGGGGGWFGGYASTANTTYSQASGGGGSGYVLTDNSYIPGEYMSDHTPYHMTKTFLGGGYAEYAAVRVCEPYEIPHAGDVITVYEFGKRQRIDLPPGRYRLKCWGACGGAYYNATYIARGGYAEGIITLENPTSLYVYVGGSGMYHNMVSYDYVHEMRPDIGFNGGGLAALYGNNTACYLTGYPGGGASDIRVNTDSLYARVIVAGGAAGATYGSSYPQKGGAGGGELGGYGVTTAYNNYQTGPGTQTASVINESVGDICGGFGYGGNSTYVVQRVAGGGGGGWFGGGSSATANLNFMCAAAHGGSGYIFIEGSYKPEGWLLNDSFKLADATLIQGGNNLPFGVTKVEIDVIETKTVRVLCRDAIGVKYFDEELNRWKLIPEAELSAELFMEYGALNMNNDTGLEDQYEILIYDPEDTTSKLKMNVAPNEQTITCETITDIKIRDSKQKLEFDPSVYNINITARRQTLVSGTKITTTFKVDKIVQSDENAKIFYVIYSDGK